MALHTQFSAPDRPVPFDKHIYGERAFWCKKSEIWLVRSQRLTVYIRLNARTDPAGMQYVPTDQLIPVFFIKKEGDQTRGIPPEFEIDELITVVTRKRVVARIGDVTDTDLTYAGGIAVARNAKELLEYLQYEMAPSVSLSHNDYITLYYVEYV